MSSTSMALVIYSQNSSSKNLTQADSPIEYLKLRKFRHIQTPHNSTSRNLKSQTNQATRDKLC